MDTSAIAWDEPLPDAPHAWDRDLLARALVAPDEGRVVVPATGVSRRPGSRLNRVAHWLSGDLLARWVVEPARSRGVTGHDVELRIELSGTRARRLADEATWPLGWTRERRPSTTRITSIVTPSHDARATALRAADQLTAGLVHLGWPLGDWYRVADR